MARPHKVGIGQKDQQFILSNLAVLLGAGVTVGDALSALKSESRKSSIARVTERMQSEIDEGSSFSQALEKAAIFPSYSVALVRSGEQSGNLSRNLELVSGQLQQEISFRSKLRGASIYPIFVLIITFAVGAGIAIFILPNLVTVFNQLDVKLPITTRALVAAGTFIKANQQLVMLISAGIFGGLVLLLTASRGFRRGLAGMAVIVPGIGRLRKHVELARLSYVIGTLLEAGIAIDEALRAAADSAGNRGIKKRAEALAAAIEQGKSFNEVFHADKQLAQLFPPAVQTIIEAGEKSGQLGTSFIKINDLYQEKIDNLSKNIVVILEPFLLFIVWGFVVLLAVSIILPIYSLVGSFNF